MVVQRHFREGKCIIGEKKVKKVGEAVVLINHKTKKDDPERMVFVG